MIFKENKKASGALSGPLVAKKGVGLDQSLSLSTGGLRFFMGSKSLKPVRCGGGSAQADGGSDGSFIFTKRIEGSRRIFRGILVLSSTKVTLSRQRSKSPS